WHDVLVRRGHYSSPLPHTPGADGAGVDLATGEDVMIMPSLWWGARESAPGVQWELLGDHLPGTYAERVAVPNECVIRRPRAFHARAVANWGVAVGSRRRWWRCTDGGGASLRHRCFGAGDLVLSGTHRPCHRARGPWRSSLRRTRLARNCTRCEWCSGIRC